LVAVYPPEALDQYMSENRAHPSPNAPLPPPAQNWAQCTPSAPVPLGSFPQQGQQPRVGLPPPPAPFQGNSLPIRPYFSPNVPPPIPALHLPQNQFTVGTSPMFNANVFHHRGLSNSSPQMAGGRMPTSYRRPGRRDGQSSGAKALGHGGRAGFSGRRGGRSGTGIPPIVTGEAHINVMSRGMGPQYTVTTSGTSGEQFHKWPASR
jgi:hypothetical protein